MLTPRLLKLVQNDKTSDKATNESYNMCRDCSIFVCWITNYPKINLIAKISNIQLENKNAKERIECFAVVTNIFFLPFQFDYSGTWCPN